MLEIDVLEPRKLPAEPDGGGLFNWGQFFKAKTPEELGMAAKRDSAEAVALVMELNEDGAGAGGFPAMVADGPGGPSPAQL